MAPARGGGAGGGGAPAVVMRRHALRPTCGAANEPVKWKGSIRRLREGSIPLREQGMPVSRTIGPLTATLERDELVFRFHDPLTMALEVPATLEYDLNQFIEEHKESLSGCQLLVDLQ